MKSSLDVPINEAVALLSRFAPSVLDELRNELPELGGELEPGGLLGVSDPRIAARAKVVLKTLRTVDGLFDGAIDITQRRQRAKNMWEFVSALIAAIGSASVVATLAMKFEAMALAAGILALAGSISAVFAQHLDNAPYRDVTTSTLISELARMRLNANLLERDLKVEMSLPEEVLADSSVADLIVKADKLFKKAFSLFGAVGVNKRIV